MYSTLVDSDVTLTISTGSVTDSGRSDRGPAAQYIGTGVFTVTGLSSDSSYPFTISQGDESYTGTIETRPASQTTPWSFIMATCSNYKWRGPSAYSAMKQVIQASEHPVKALLHPDDVNYTDTTAPGTTANGNYDNPQVLPNSTGDPQDTGVGSDYAIGWAVWHGHEPAYAAYQEEAFQWVLRNVPHYMSGGDHAVEGNHCRGQVGNTDYHGCDATLRATALAEWDAFIGDGNPDPLRTGEDYFGFEIGPIRFVFPDELNHADPYDGTNAAESRATHPLFGDTQLTDIMTYLDVDTVPFKCMCMPTGFSKAGQPWADWWSDEAAYWHDTLLTGDNLDGTSGWLFGLVGDNHTLHAMRFDGGTGTGFWAFCPGTTGNSGATLGWMAAGNEPEIGTKTGHTHYVKSVQQGGANGGIRFGAFLHVIVHADESPQRLEIIAYEIDGSEAYRYQMKAESGNDNQWESLNKMRVAL